MTQAVKRMYVEKRKPFAVEAQSLYQDLKENLGIGGLTGVRLVHRYDLAGLTEQEYILARNTIFSEPTVDDVYDEELPSTAGDSLFAMEFLPGQYDQRADSAAQCVQMLTQKERPAVASAKVVILQEAVSPDELARIKAYCINPVESREAQLTKPDSLDVPATIPDDVAVLTGFIAKTEDELKAMMADMGLAMSLADLTFCQSYFRDNEHRDPTITELKVIDTYWSDHCRHTTFLTNIEQVEMEYGPYSQPVADAFAEYRHARQDVYGDAPRAMSLMDIALMGMRELKRSGKLTDLDESDEINACSIVVPVDVDGRTEDWLVMFKNETHNHPTEIEPFGGAATCLGGAIRDPLSGRSYVYQAMRVTGSGDPRSGIADTLPGKLPQRKITLGAAAGYSSYGNQIGLATGQVAEVYDEGFIAKRMEIGAVIAAAPKRNVVREQPQPGDVIILLGGRTGRDGCGGATGSSKEHTEESLASCGAEVQKGNAPTERKLQRLFRNPEVSTLIKRCNDFGAGGVSVAIGELADGLAVNLDAVPKKYEGLDGTELAISESQERMAVVVAAEQVDTFCQYADAENLEASVVAIVTDKHRLQMAWRGKTIVDLSRDFLNTNGVTQYTQVKVAAPDSGSDYFKQLPQPVLAQKGDLRQAWLAMLADLNVCSQKGLVERFDSTIGAGTVLMPFGGTYQATPAEGMAAKIPVLDGETSTATLMTYGYNPQLSSWSPFHGALYAVIEAVAKVVALGGDYRAIRLTLQEYFEKLGNDPAKWGKPFSALLGAYYAQKRLGIPAIGGKDSMSGTFKDLQVPPTLVAFAVDVAKAQNIVSQEFKAAGNPVVLVSLPRDERQLPDFAALETNYSKIHDLIRQEKVLATHTVRYGGVAAAISKMAFGNRIGVCFDGTFTSEELFASDYGSILLEMAPGVELKAAFGEVPFRCLGYTQANPVLTVNGQDIALRDAQAAWEKPLERIFPTQAGMATGQPQNVAFSGRNSRKPAVRIAKPRVFIPVFPGTNCEYDSARAFAQAGGLPQTLVIRNLTSAAVEEAIAATVAAIRQSQIVMLPGGFSAGDEPDGSGKFIATLFRNPRVKEAVTELLQKRDGLMLGICNGFQALIKLGLVPYGEIRDLTPDCPTLTYNTLGRHISCLSKTKVVSNLSPWFSRVEVGDIHTVAMSHGEGRFVASPAMISQLIQQGQIATQYVDFDGKPSMDIIHNPNGSVEAVEGITSPDGRVLGKMGHSERTGEQIAKNVPGNKDQQIFQAGINYFN
ncbi:phosphoribosylformylglycinamidine synthase [Propionispora vibrioides]|uniref:Phosphoribosylformylglycinamidine synthase n=1 Tax=Propionispora vibrioides TaxID=112903 RepID=A0A1H8VCP3_9FIRM|nr:phosphoribosylformylglycinamidine synthase [Propionispora vibrioides]SEP13149.1 phosphoribosylformylglycinamidine synthase [Propionispora vibrioides]